MTVYFNNEPKETKEEKTNRETTEAVASIINFFAKPASKNISGANKLHFMHMTVKIVKNYLKMTTKKFSLHIL